MNDISSFQTQSLGTAMQQMQIAQSNELNNKTSAKDIKQINATAKEFESVFLSQMLSHMFQGVETGGTFGGGSAEKVYRSMMVNEYGKQLSENGGFGIAKEVASFMLSVQEQQ